MRPTDHYKTFSQDASGVFHLGQEYDSKDYPERRSYPLWREEGDPEKTKDW